MELQYNIEILEDAESIVMTSFVSQKSITYLDLQISKHPTCFSSFRSQNPFISSVENLRARMVPERRFLYSLHLDYPVERDYSMSSNKPVPSSFYDDTNHSSHSLHPVVLVNKDFYATLVSGLLKFAFEQTDDKFKLLTGIVDIPEDFILLPRHIRILLVNHLYENCTDSNFIRKCIKRYSLLFSVIRDKDDKQAEKLEFLLYHAPPSKFHLTDRRRCEPNMADFCIISSSIRCVRTVLKYTDEAHFTEFSLELLYVKIVEFKPLLSGIPFQTFLRQRRSYHMLQIIFIYYLKDFPESIDPTDHYDALRSVWNSIPVNFISLQEFTDVFGQVLTPKEIGDIHGFYEEAICRTVSYPEPKSLAQYCRSCIRKSLFENYEWLPDKIEKLKLPSRIKSYLNLEI